MEKFDPQEGHPKGSVQEIADIVIFLVHITAEINAESELVRAQVHETPLNMFVEIIGHQLDHKRFLYIENVAHRREGFVAARLGQQGDVISFRLIAVRGAKIKDPIVRFF